MALLAVVVLSAVAASAAVTVQFLRGRAQAEQPRPSTAYSPSPPVAAPPARPSPSSSAEAGTCPPGRSGPLRLDTRFAAGPAGPAGNGFPFSVSLPDDYWSACRQYPVIYALHGKTQDNVSFMDEALSLRGAMAAGVLEPSIIVTPDSYSTGRWENLPTGPAEDNLIQHLIPWIEQNYRVRPGPSYRLLVGFSMGGHGAIRFGLKYPQLFAGVWSVDGAMAGPEDYLPYAEGKPSGTFRILAVGGRENGERVRRLVDSLERVGVTIPYAYRDLRHEFVDFVADDGRTGWVAMRYLNQQLGRDL